MLWRQGKQLFSEMSLCTECGVDKRVEVEMASLEVGILGALHDKTGIMQLTIRTKTYFGYDVCCSMSSFGFSSPGSRYELVLCSTSHWLLHFLVLLFPSPLLCCIEFKLEHWSVRFLLLQLL